MDEVDMTELDQELRTILGEIGLAEILDEVDVTIAEGRSETERRKIGKERPTDELVGVDYTDRERYELLLDAIRRAAVEPAGFQQSMESRLLDDASVDSVSFVDQDGDVVRRLSVRAQAATPAESEDFQRVDAMDADKTAAIVDSLDPRRGPESRP